MRALLVTCIVIVLTACPLHAQEKIENSEISFYVQTSGGNPAVCGIDTVLIYRDQTYQRGALAGVRVSLAWQEAKGDIGLLLKGEIHSRHVVQSVSRRSQLCGC